MPLITTNYNIGCDGPTIGKLVADDLKLELFDDIKLQDMADELGVSDPDLLNLAKKPPRFLNQLLSKKSQMYLDALEAVIHKVAEKGEGVIIGHGSQFLLQDFGCAFHVKIQSKPSSRVQWIVSRQGLDVTAARTLVKKADEQQKSFLQYAFNFDVDDPNVHDLVINMEKISERGAARIIVESTRLDDLSECSYKAYQAMERLSLAKKIRRAMLENHVDLSTLDINVDENNVIRISGMASSEADKKRLPYILEKMSAVKKFDISVSVWSQSVIG